MKLIKSKIKALGLLALLLISCQPAEGMSRIRSWFTNKPAMQEQINVARNCPICLHDFAQNDALTALDCTNVPHIFHKECLNGSIDAGNKSCPMCRKLIPMKFKTLKQLVKEFSLMDSVAIMGASLATSLIMLNLMKYINIQYATGTPSYYATSIRNVLHFTGMAFLMKKLVDRYYISGIAAGILGLAGFYALVLPFLQKTTDGGQTYTTHASEMFNYKK